MTPHVSERDEGNFLNSDPHGTIPPVSSAVTVVTTIAAATLNYCEWNN